MKHFFSFLFLFFLSMTAIAKTSDQAFVNTFNFYKNKNDLRKFLSFTAPEIIEMVPVVEFKNISFDVVPGHYRISHNGALAFEITPSNISKGEFLVNKKPWLFNPKMTVEERVKSLQDLAISKTTTELMDIFIPRAHAIIPIAAAAWIAYAVVGTAAFAGCEYALNFSEGQTADQIGLATTVCVSAGVLWLPAAAVFGAGWLYETAQLPANTPIDADPVCPSENREGLLKLTAGNNTKFEFRKTDAGYDLSVRKANNVAKNFKLDGKFGQVIDKNVAIKDGERTKIQKYFDICSDPKKIAEHRAKLKSITGSAKSVPVKSGSSPGKS